MKDDEIISVSTFLVDEHGDLRKPLSNIEHVKSDSFYRVHSDHLEYGYGDLEYFVVESDEKKEYRIYFCDHTSDCSYSFTRRDYASKKSIAEEVCARMNAERVAKYGDVSKTKKEIPERLLLKLEAAIDRLNKANGAPEEHIEREKTQSLLSLEEVAKKIIESKNKVHCGKP